MRTRGRKGGNNSGDSNISTVSIIGWYETAIEENEEAHWSSANHEYILKLLIVS